MYKLIIEDDEGKTTVVPLIRDEITIGRKEGNTIRLTERNVSRKHAKLLKQNGTVFIEDLTSYNGIKVNGDRIAGRAPVNEGDRIQIGDYQLALKLDKAAQAGASPTQEIRDEKTTPFIKENGASPTAMLELTPTVQNQMANAAEAPARLVVVSSNFAGQEFQLDKAAVVIGRTDENDVVINHRSISRHHAKIVRENGHYHIVDLQSANGVRVNGEEYGKVELRKGDHIDLGHVRLRFVAPNEDFLFDRDAQVVDVGGTKKSKMGLIIGAVVALLLIGGGVVVLIKMSGKPGGDNAGGTLTPQEKESQVAKLLLDADRALKSEEWEQAIAKCDEAIKLDGTQELARDKRQKAEAEQKNKKAYDTFIKAVAGGDYDMAIASYGDISEDSVYRQKAAEKYAQAKKQYLRIHLDAARKAKAANKCEEARQHVEAAMTVDEGNTEGQDILKSCGAQVKIAVHEPRQPKQHTETPTQPKIKEPKQEPETSDTPPVQNVAIEKILQDAQDAYVHGQYSTAIGLAKGAVKGQPSRAWRIIGASSCFLKDRNGAVAAYGKLDGQGRNFLKYVCSRQAITIP
jgi:pSer/pThr/pTyr-binding forkhead associated (FHA) protein